MSVSPWSKLANTGKPSAVLASKRLELLLGRNESKDVSMVDLHAGCAEHAGHEVLNFSTRNIMARGLLLAWHQLAYLAEDNGEAIGCGWEECWRIGEAVRTVGHQVGMLNQFPHLEIVGMYGAADSSTVFKKERMWKCSRSQCWKSCEG